MLVVAVGVCLTVLRLADTPEWSRRGGEAERSGRLFPGGFGEAESLVVEREGLRLELQRVGTRWTLAQPFIAGADQGEVMRFLDRLERAPLVDRLSLRDLRRRGLAMTDFGLAPPAARVVVRGPLFRVEAAFGVPTPAGNEVYLALDSADDVVWVTDRQIFAALPVSIEQWRDRSLLRDTAGNLTALEIRRPGVPFLKVVRDGEAWQLVQPISGRASARVVGEAIKALQAIRIERFIWSGATNGADVASGDARTRLVHYGLDSETAVQAQVWESGNPVGARIRFGREVEGSPGLVYALAPSDNSVVAVSNSVLRSLPQGVGEVRSRMVFDAAPSAVRRLAIQYADETVELERRDAPPSGFWRMTAPVQGDVDSPTVEQFASAVLALRADYLVDHQMRDGPAVAAGEPLCRLDVAFASVTQRVSVVQSVSDLQCYDLTINQSPTVFVVAASNMPPLLTRKSGVLELANRTILALPAQTIRRITAKGADRLETVERKGSDGDEQWTVAGGTADADVLRAWAALLGNWRADRVVRLGAGAQDVAAFGMGAPWMEIMVDLASDEAVRRSVLVGRVSEGGGRYVSVRGHDVIYEVSAESVAVLMRRLTR